MEAAIFILILVLIIGSVIAACWISCLNDEKRRMKRHHEIEMALAEEKHKPRCHLEVDTMTGETLKSDPIDPEPEYSRWARTKVKTSRYMAEALASTIANGSGFANSTASVPHHQIRKVNIVEGSQI